MTGGAGDVCVRAVASPALQNGPASGAPPKGVITEGNGDVVMDNVVPRTAPVLGLLVPAELEQSVHVVLVPRSSVGFSDAIGGGLLDDTLTGACEGGRFGVYLDLDREAKTLAANNRAAVLLVRLGHLERAVLAGLRGDALIVGIDTRGGDRDVPAGVLVAACQAEPRIAVDVDADLDTRGDVYAP